MPDNTPKSDGRFANAPSSKTSKVKSSAVPFHPEYLATVQEMVELLFSDEEICCELGIDTRTLQRWQLENPELRHALKRTDAQWTHLIESELLNRAVGYERSKVKCISVKGKGPVSIPIAEEIAPDLPALIIMLVNLRPDRWQKDRDVPPPTPPTLRDKMLRQFWYNKFIEDMEDQTRREWEERARTKPHV